MLPMAWIIDRLNRFKENVTASEIGRKKAMQSKEKQGLKCFLVCLHVLVR